MLEVQSRYITPELQSVFRPSVQPYMISWLAYDPQVPQSDAESLHAAHPEIIEDMNHVLKTVSSEGENEAANSNPDLPLSDELMSVIVGFL
ncbi:hypothetical protein [Planococcus halotolerans]|uniref:Uncharacterized protein n=1 Tax=Planococcus halotolerans TaxID=2233542 RepID=A0A365KWZ8_9BACL|nr:hypothetical protein [Planococcus halotolerans]QHJ72272.1 hypothetical protein DNR44_017420 [Planococcus halotolerans]RAZ77706.1 hypothetical protein DP120_09490 [Planococcus halotolerans]